MIHFDSEKCMEDFFFENYSEYAECFGIDYLSNFKACRQVTLGKYGICDLLFISAARHDASGELFITARLVELKNTALSLQDVAQVARYKSFFDALDGKAKNIDVDFSACLVGLKSFPGSGDLCYLCQGIGWLDVYETEISPHKGVVLSRVRGWQPSSNTEESFRKFVGDFVLPFASSDEVADGKGA